MSMFFRSRSPRTLHRKSAGKALVKAPVPTLDLKSHPVSPALPGPRTATAPVHHSPKRRRRALGYRTAGAPAPRMFRVT
jgi:hypothetical protein